MALSRTSLLALAAAVGIGAGTATLAQTPIRDVLSPAGISIAGTVTDVFGNKFVLQDGSGKVLVESGPDWHRKLDIKAGETLTITGRPEGGSFEAFTITRADGTTIEVRPAGGPPPWAGKRGPGGPGGPEGRGPDGRGPGGPGDRGPRHVSPAEEKPRAELLEILRQAGYRDLDDVDRKARHYEVEARNRFGEKVEVHIDFAGNIYKEKKD
ncbi:YpeB-like protein with putative protease inhibitory function [Stella humosa]|uniref:YpeB-like protein with putative protease inhibitory function n=1 Tax=Stella humosa TaxID=94 RepID=A0A3N1KXR7_9PROT|nr:PepSY domain-containing protein [Stella humosa]ROP84047.1 YpeB-like protein with putative protease inhibitory function [Stella humosa]BBK33558.1 hypothetical protein STHU_41920 [Stella humosa]